MKTLAIFTAIGLQSLALQAQQTVLTGSGQSFQFNTVPGTVAVRTFSYEGLGGKPVTGRPVSATEERHTLQILGDGTRIESANNDRFYRDDQGRTRIERTDGTVLVNDPVQDVIAETNGNRKIVRRNTSSSVRTESMSPEIADKLKAEKMAVYVAVASGGNSVADKLKAEAATKGVEEDLGYQSINGVTAHGSRMTTTIPAGQIGNDRPIKIVSERWYSQDLQMNVKTVNSDPRFGETTYQLTNILQGAPDPSLFKVATGHLGETVPE